MMRQLTDGVKHLLIINIIMFVGMMCIGNGGEPFSSWFALHFPLNDAFKPWQILTHMFMHSNVMYSHILFNMFALWMFGCTVEQTFGTKKFIIFYLLSGFGAASIQIAFSYYQFNSGLAQLLEAGYSQQDVLSTLADGQYNNMWRNVLGDDVTDFAGAYVSPMVGASGAIMGVLVAFGMLFPNSKLMLIFFPVPIKAKYFIPGIIALDLFSAISGQSFFSPDNTAYAAHIGGAFTGFLLMYFWKKNSMNKHRWD